MYRSLACECQDLFFCSDDQLAGHRILPQLMGIIPQNTGGFGDVEEAARVFVATRYFNGGRIRVPRPCHPQTASQ